VEKSFLEIKIKGQRSQQISKSKQITPQPKLARDFQCLWRQQIPNEWFHGRVRNGGARTLACQRI